MEETDIVELKDELNSLYKKISHALFIYGDSGKNDMPLTPNEQRSMDIIMDLCEEDAEGPTVREFQKKAGISAPNAAYRVKKLIDGKYLKKYQDRKDQRKFHLRPTARYESYAGHRNNIFFEELARLIDQEFTEEDCNRLEQMLSAIEEQIRKLEDSGKGGIQDDTDEGKAE